VLTTIYKFIKTRRIILAAYLPLVLYCSTTIAKNNQILSLPLPTKQPIEECKQLDELSDTASAKYFFFVKAFDGLLPIPNRYKVRADTLDENALIFQSMKTASWDIPVNKMKSTSGYIKISLFGADDAKRFEGDVKKISNKRGKVLEIIEKQIETDITQCYVTDRRVLLQITDENPCLCQSILNAYDRLPRD